MDVRRTGVWFTVLALGLAAFHAPNLDAPFGLMHMNAGSYFGVFMRNWEHHGFWATRGLPIMPKLAETVASGMPYVHHPPGMSWLFHALGGQEWSIRLPTIAATFLAAIYWFRLCCTRLPRGVAMWSAAILAFSPALAVLCQASYEPLVIACGLVVMSEVVNPVRPRWLSIASQIAAAFAGTWIDWGFAFLGLACIPLAWTNGPLAALRRLAVPGATAVIAAATVVWWTHWALDAPGVVKPPAADRDLAMLAGSALFRPWPPFDWWFPGLCTGISDIWTPWLFGVFALGIGFAFAQHTRFAIAMSIAAVSPFVLLSMPGDLIWHGFPVPMIALAGGAALSAGLASGRASVRRASAIAAAAMLTGMVDAGWSLRARSETTFYERLGAALSEAAREPGWGATHCVPIGLACYYRSPRIAVFGAMTPASIEPFAKNLDGLGWRCVFVVPSDRALRLPHMEQHLQACRRQRLPSLEVEFCRTAAGEVVRIDEAWLYTLCEPKR
ncbi:MAG TPA: hypothetical protein VF384_16045 [Planctomycetota bacterium]